MSLRAGRPPSPALFFCRLGRYNQIPVSLLFLMLTPLQIDLMRQSGVDAGRLSPERACHIAAARSAETLSEQELLDFLTVANALYRGGAPVIDDADYDFIYLAALRARHPEHPFLHMVEPEPEFAGKAVELPAPMLSTEKAYSLEEVERWLARVEKAAAELGLDPADLNYRLTPKLDGYAAYDDGQVLYTRGDGRRGADISRVFARGLQVANGGERGQGPGEIVVSRAYFDAHLAEFFDNPRNFQASVIKEKELDVYAEQAIAAGAAVFYPFSVLPAWEGGKDELLRDFEQRVQAAWQSVDYDVDGVVLEATDPELKQYMGATRHHHRWQLAFKINQESAEVTVVRVVPQTSRSGRVTPVAEFEPVRLSGALLSRATAHHYRMVQDKGIGPGAVISLARSGEVIPKIEAVLSPAEAEIPEHCPSCEHVLAWDGDYLVCPNNLSCPAQISNSMAHFFKVLANNDGFGGKTIDKLYQHGLRGVEDIYALRAADFEGMGFGPKQSQNLEAQLLRSRQEAVEDSRFLAAFGVFRLGLGNCERLLQYYPLAEIFDLTEEDICRVEGFAEKTAAVARAGLAAIRPMFERLLALGFNVQATPIAAAPPDHPLQGKTLVLTGTMQAGGREALAKQAKARGAKVGAAVSAKTDYLVAGEDAGAAKLSAAEAKGVRVIDEAEFLRLLAGETL